MSDLRGRTFSDLVAGLNAGQHLTVDAVVAFVDGELGASPRTRAAEHLTECPSCAAEVTVQRQARSVIRSAACPRVPANLLAALCDIPQTADLPSAPDGLAVTDDGTVVTVTDAGRVIDASRAADARRVTEPGRAPLGSSAPLGTSPRWGIGSALLGRRGGRTGAGAVLSGLVLGALIWSMVDEPVGGSAAPQPQGPPAPAFQASKSASTTPSVVPAVAVTQSDTGLSDQAAMLRMTTQPGWQSLHLLR